MRPSAEISVIRAQTNKGPVEPETAARTSKPADVGSDVAGSANGAAAPASRDMNGLRTSVAEPVDLNSASKETLMSLPGLTEQDAINIIQGRPYRSTLQFKTKSVIAAEVYGRIADRVIAKQPKKPRKTAN
jgi:DNA uptake protein ComE-like DNA-binding protein